MKIHILKRKSRGFGLTELLVVMIILGILAGISMLAFGRNSDSAEAQVIMSHLDSAKNALLAYSMENRTRTSDAISPDFFSLTTDGAVRKSLDKYLDASVKNGGKATEYFDKLRVRSFTNSNNETVLQVGFVSFTASTGTGKALDDRIAGNQAPGYSKNIGVNALWLNIR